MPVKIRLSRIGKKHVPFYRVVAVDSRKKRDGACLDNIGTYDALSAKVTVFHEELYNSWIAKGAQVTDSAKRIFKIYKKSLGTPATPAETTAKAPRKPREKKSEAAAEAVAE